MNNYLEIIMWSELLWVITTTTIVSVSFYKIGQYCDRQRLELSLKNLLEERELMTEELDLIIEKHRQLLSHKKIFSSLSD